MLLAREGQTQSRSACLQRREHLVRGLALSSCLRFARRSGARPRGAVSAIHGRIGLLRREYVPGRGRGGADGAQTAPAGLEQLLLLVVCLLPGRRCHRRHVQLRRPHVRLAGLAPDFARGLSLYYRSYALYLDQLQAERKQAQEEHNHAEEVAALHSRTMDALASAMAANARLDAAIQASPLAVLTLDHTGVVTSWNQMAEHILGWTAEEAIGRPLPLSQGMAEAAMLDVVAMTLQGEMVAGIEMKQWRRDGSPFEAAIWTAPLRETQSKISGILITVADVSDRTRLEEQLRLSQKMEAVGRLAGGVAHDFNNLLTVINGYSSMLLDTLKGNPYAVSQASEILGAGTRAGELVSQLLAFSRRQMIKPKPIEINQLIHNVERMLRRIIGEHIEFRTDLQSGAGWIHADPNQIEAVLLNLATNAQDAMAKGGVLEVATAAVRVAPGQEETRLELPAGSYVRLTVCDTGHGMDAETQQHIFEPFYTTKQLGRGTGLDSDRLRNRRAEWRPDLRIQPCGRGHDLLDLLAAARECHAVRFTRQSRRQPESRFRDDPARRR